MKGDVFGQKGDFTTAPEISQVFGEVCVHVCCSWVWTVKVYFIPRCSAKCISVMNLKLCDWRMDPLQWFELFVQHLCPSTGGARSVCSTVVRYTMHILHVPCPISSNRTEIIFGIVCACSVDHATADCSVADVWMDCSWPSPALPAGGTGARKRDTDGRHPQGRDDTQYTHGLQIQFKIAKECFTVLLHSLDVSLTGL